MALILNQKYRHSARPPRMAEVLEMQEQFPMDPGYRAKPGTGFDNPGEDPESSLVDTITVVYSVLIGGRCPPYQTEIMASDIL